MQILSVQIGEGGTLGRGNRTEPSGFDKRPVDGLVRVTELGIEGDRIVEKRFHGGPHRALLVYPAAHYDAWRDEGRDLPPGGFGENLTIAGYDETTARIGDTFTNGKIIVQVSQPRQPCWKIDARWNTTGLTARALETGRNGWYLRVLQPGQLQAGDELQCENRGDERLTIHAVHEAMTHRKRLVSAMRQVLADCESLNPEWREAFV